MSRGPQAVFIFGTRPELIKLAPVWRALKEMGGSCEAICTHQHVELLRPVVCGWPAAQDMLSSSLVLPSADVFKGADRLGGCLGWYIQELCANDPRFLIERARRVVVQGDTISTLGGALAAKFQGAEVVHVEAGLRTFNDLDPWPEEMNRKMVDSVSDLLFCPTASSYRNAQVIGGGKEISWSGNTVIDAVQEAVSSSSMKKRSIKNLPKKFILWAMHRRGESAFRWMKLCVKTYRAMKTTKSYNEIDHIFLFHPNDFFYSAFQAEGIDPADLKRDSLKVMGELSESYQGFIGLLKKSSVVVTDSGGLVEECVTLRVPCIVARDVTERHEAISSGLALMADDTPEALALVIYDSVQNSSKWPWDKVMNPFSGLGGVSRPSSIIAQRLLRQ